MQSFSPSDYLYYQDHSTLDSAITLPGEDLCDAITRVCYAADEKSAGQIMSGIYLEAEYGELNVVALNGTIAAWDRIPYNGDLPIKAIVPKTAAMKLTSLGIVDDLDISFNRFTIIFRSDAFTVSSRLIDGKYFNYRQLFGNGEHTVSLPRKAMLATLNRASLCTKEGTRTPVIFTFRSGEVGVSLAAASSIMMRWRNGDAIPM